jgi:uncharacterized membrane protein
MLQRKNTAVALAVALLAMAIVGTYLASGVLAAPKDPTPNRTAKADLGVYSNNACTQSLNSIDWGIVSPGDFISRTVYVKNLGSIPLQLSLSKTNLSPATADRLIALNWNLEGVELAAGQMKTATLTLTMSSSASGFTTFSIDALIGGQAVRGKAI